MTFSLIAYLLFLLGVGTYLLMCVRTDGWRLFFTPGLFISIVMFSFFTYMATLGHPVPTWASMQHLKNMRVISVEFVEPTAIYVWGYPEGATEPLSITLPWNIEQAKEAHEAQGEAGEAGVPLVMGWSDGEWVFHPAPVEPLPEKE